MFFPSLHLCLPLSSNPTPLVSSVVSPWCIGQGQLTSFESSLGPVCGCLKLQEGAGSHSKAAAPWTLTWMGQALLDLPSSLFFSFLLLPFSSQPTMQAQIMCFLNSIWHSSVTQLLALARLSTKIISTQNWERWERGTRCGHWGRDYPPKLWPKMEWYNRNVWSWDQWAASTW